MDYRDRILAIIQLRGPMQPFAISKELTTNSTLASAMLSEMSDKGLLKVSALKVGSSPLYFIPGQEDQLVRFTAGLNEKDKVTLALLQQEKVLRDSMQDPLTRVSLRSLKDFAKQLEVQHEEGSEVFWKWFLVLDTEAEPVIRKLLEKTVPILSALSATLSPEQIPARSEPTVSSVQPVSVSSTITPPAVSSTSVLPPRTELKRRIRQQSLAQVVEKPVSQLAQPASVEPILSPSIFLSDAFSTRVQQFLKSISAEVVSGQQTRKGEYSLVIRFSTSIGILSFACVSKDKKTVSDTDISSAYVHAQHKHLPLLFIATGDLTKGAKLLLQTALPDVVFKRI